MNKKLLFAAMSFAALTACSTDDFESQQQVAEGVSPIQFEVINNSETTRASMDGNTLVWNANDGDLFTLYHGATAPTATGAQAATGSFSNAIYTAQAGAAGEVATLSTPSMINKGAAIMVWPVDTTSYDANGAFSVAGADLSVKIPANQDNIEKNIPYVSDLIDIKAYNNKAPYNTAGYKRSYPVYMRPMASQLTLKADYAGTDATINALATGADPIEPIKVTSVELETSATGSTKFTTEIPVVFTDTATINTNNSLTAGTTGIKAQWNKAKKNNNWTHVASFGTASASVTKLTTTCLTGNESSKFLILPQAQMATTGIGVAGAAVTVNTIYGKVVVGQGSSYTPAQLNDAWYRFVSATTTAADGETKATDAESTGDNAGKFKTYANVSMGLKQTINGFSSYKATTGVVKYEPVGAAATRYVKVLLDYLDMDGLHIKNNKHLYDAVRVWKEIGKGSVRVLLDGDEDGNFEISQKTIAKINEINAATANEATPRTFTVMPCNTHPCNTIVITGGSEIAQNLTFIQSATFNSNKQADVALKAGENWKWNSTGKVYVDATANGISNIINNGTFASTATATLAVYNNATTPVAQNIPFVNNGIWNITAGDINVQFNVTNNGKVNISKGAEYHQDAVATTTPTVTTFTNNASTVPERFYKNDPSISASNKKKFVEKIGQVKNEGVFAALAGRGEIENYGLIEHADKDAKTYITRNQTTSVNFATALGASNKMGRINLPIENKDENNVSISASTATGMVSVTVASTADLKDPSDASGKKYVLKGGALDLSTLGTYVNYCIIKKGVTEITKVATQVKYIEFNDEDNTEIAWNLGGTVSSKETATYDGLMILSPVNINLTTKITVSKATFLGAKLYVGGEFITSGTKPYEGYFGKTTDNAKTMYITY